MAATHQYTGVLLAAGTSSRYRAALSDTTGSPTHKLMVTLPDGRSVAQTSAMQLLAVLPDTLAVVGDTPSELPALLRDLGCVILPAPSAPRGMGISLATAAQHLLTRVTSGESPIGCVVALADMPWLGPNTLQYLLRHADQDRIVVPVFNGQRGHPVVFGSQFLPELAALDGDTGARDLLIRYGAIEVECNDAGVIRDIDTPEDLLLPPAAS